MLSLLCIVPHGVLGHHADAVQRGAARVGAVQLAALGADLLGEGFAVAQPRRAACGAFGSDPDDVNAYAASAFYSVDRYASYKQDWGEFYEAGGLLIADRYTTSNAVHQTSKLPPEKRDAFLDWLFDFEYHLLGLPEPTRVLYLDMPVEATEQMMRLREEATHTKADIHEKDEAYLRRCRENAAYVVARCGWTRIDCAKDGAPRLINDIHREVMACVADLIG